MFASAILVSSMTMAAVAVSAPIDPPTVRQSANGEFMTKYYPPSALKRGEQGKVAFELSIDRDGFLSSCVVTRSSGHVNLDKETCDFLTRYAKVAPATDADGRAVATTKQGYMNWQLPAGTKLAAANPNASSIDPDKKICKRFARTGSKVGYVRSCMTRAEWALQERGNRDDMQRIQDEGAINSQRPQ